VPGAYIPSAPEVAADPAPRPRPRRSLWERLFGR
jgi:hypothetical protein